MLATRCVARIRSLWRRFLSGAYLVEIAWFSSLLLEAPRFALCATTTFSLELENWIDCEGEVCHKLPRDALSPRALVLLRPLSILSVIELFTSLASTYTAIAAIARRETTGLGIVAFFTSNVLGIILAVIVIIMKGALAHHPPDVAAILEVRPDLSSQTVLNIWNGFPERKPISVALFLFVATGSLQTAAVYFRHWVQSPWKVSSPWQPYVGKEKRRVMTKPAVDDQTTWRRLTLDCSQPVIPEMKHGGRHRKKGFR
jgi:hypothetical protein